MSADRLHPAIDIPRGLWRGAIVRHAHNVEAVVELDQPGHPWVYIAGATAAAMRADLSLRLDDPLGLGLAGLAARVAERIGAEPREALHTLVMDLSHYPWALPQWCDAWLHDRPAEYDRVIREAATLLARLDRLAAAVDPTYTVRPGVVPRWTRLEPLDGDPQYGWALLVPLPNGDSAGKCFLPLDEPDPIEAAGAALEVCGG